MRFARAIGSQLALGSILVLTTFFSNIAAQAASISYGNFGPVPPGVTFIGVTESSGTDPVPLYGPPTPYSVGLDFDPFAFVATTSGGGADITDGQLNLAVAGLSTPSGSIGINTVNVFEAGDYTLAGGGGPPTSVAAGAIIRATVTQINGINVAPINLAPVNASFSDALPGTVVVGPWSLGTTVDIGTQLAGLGFAANQVATRVELAINNSLIATSELNSVSFIAKKEFQLSVGTKPVGNIPEPATAMLACLALCAVGLITKRSAR